MAGVTFDADLVVTGKVSQTGTPSASGDLVTKAYADSAANSTKNIIVRVAAPGNTTLASAVENGDTLDGVVLATGNLVLLPSQTTQTENGLYIVNASGAPTRHSDFDASGDLVIGTVVRVSAGTANGGSTYLMSAQGATPWVPGSSTSTWVKLLNNAPPYLPGSTDVSVSDGGTGRSTSTTPYGVIAAGTSATNAQQTIAPSATTTHALFSTGTSSLPAFRAVAQSDVANLSTDLAAKADKATFPVHIAIALSDETTAITTGAGKAFLHLPYAMTLTGVFSEVNTVSSSGLVTVDINEGAGAGTSILSTKLSIDASEETSATAATAAVIGDTALAQYARISFDIDSSGTGAKGLKVHLLGTRAV